MTLALLMLIAALICGLLALAGVASRIDLTALAAVLVALSLLVEVL